MPRVGIIGLAVALSLATVQNVSAEVGRHHREKATTKVAEGAGGRPLTIGGRRGRGLVRRGDDIIAPGGFSAHGYGYPVATADDRREAANARIRASASGPYGSGFDGLGGTDVDGEVGSSNPFWGNGFSSYVGYNGVPTDLAFGPGFANRHLADHDPADDDDDASGPEPGDLGYRIDPGH